MAMVSRDRLKGPACRRPTIIGAQTAIDITAKIIKKGLAKSPALSFVI